MKKILTRISMVMIVLMVGISAMAQEPSMQIGPVDNYGFMTSSDGSQWTYTASFEKQYGRYTMVTLDVYNSQRELVGKIIDSLKIDDENVTGINQAEINPLVTQKFFNGDDKYEVMLFLHAQTKNYEGRYLNHVFSIGAGETVTRPDSVVEGRQVYAQNQGEYGNENYIMVFARDSASTSKDYTLCFDICRKYVYGDEGAYRTFRVPYANVAALTDLQPIFMFKNGKNINYVMQQYEKPYFDPNTPLDQDPVVTPDNNLVITYMNQYFKVLHTTKIPVIQDANAQLLYTFPALGALSGVNDIIVNYNGTEPVYVITQEKYDLSSDGSVNSYYLYDVAGNKLNTIAENTKGRIKMSPVAGQEDQWLFMKEEYDGEFLFVNVPSCEVTSEISVYLNDKDVLSSAIDRYPCGDSYEYAVALLQGDNESDGTIAQRIAWLDTEGNLKRFEKINMGKYIEAAQVNITAEVLNPWLFNTDDAREYMVLVKRYNPNKTTEKETALLICNNNGEILLDYGKSAELGGDINMVYVTNEGGQSSLCCVYSDGNALTLNYTPLPLNSLGNLKGEGTLENPYQLSIPSDFMKIQEQPSAHYEVVNDVDFLGVPFDGVKGEFTGTLDGNGYALKNLLLNGGGLFGTIKDSVWVKDLRFENPTLILTADNKNNAGILANAIQGGFTEDGVKIYAELSNVHIINPVIVGRGYTQIVGGLVGDASLFMDVNTCSILNAEINAPQATVGALVGNLATGSSVHACVFTGKVSGAVVGGIAALIAGDTPVYDCRVDADLEGNNTIGGVVGYSDRAKVYNCFAQGTLTLDAKATIGKVGGIIGEIEPVVVDATTKKDLDTKIVLSNCLVGISEILIPAGQDIAAHRVAGFTGCDNYEYDWDNIDWDKDESEWPRIYGNPEKYMENNYVVSDLAALDATIQLTDTTTEGATLDAMTFLPEWCAGQGFNFGSDVTAPWVWSEGNLVLWFESEISTGVEDIFGGNCGDIIGSGKPAVKKIFIDGQLYILREDGLYNMTGARVQ